ncbi:hypothetical protein ACFY3B_22930 [Micromonospora parva]|uniref:Uncharacterized protein n=1 Tax=Micromonospora parva TaxID=1464048 RepID=A0ABW6VYM5_9ACTN
MNLVEKFGVDGFLEGSWVLPPEAVETLRAHVDLTPKGRLVDAWPVASDVAVIVQAWVDDPVDVRSGAWFVSSVQAAA